MSVDVKTDYRREDDRLQAVTVRWGEFRPTATATHAGVGMIVLICGLIALFLAPVLAVFCFLGGGLMMRRVVFGLTRPRAVTFERDGRILMPYGRPSFPDVERLADHHNVRSIEARQKAGDPLFEVVLLTASGNLFVLSDNLYEWVAVKAAVQLTTGLEALRREEAAMLSFAAPDGGPAINWGEARAVIN